MKCRVANPALLGLQPDVCLAIEDSVTGTAAAQRAGCPVLVVPNDVAVPRGPRRRHITSLADVGVADLRRVFDELSSEFGERTA
jgi:beta-phosphoglucomutase-like phosphatase (HAD superfamily)